MPLRDIHKVPTNPPLAYFITVRTYGTWLHGDARGSVDRFHNTPGTPLAPPNPLLQKSAAERMRHDPINFGASAAEFIEKVVAELCAHRGWHLFTVKMRSNHLHLVAEGAVTADRMRSDIKSRTTRRLREENFIKPNEHPWTTHGSTPHLWTPEQLLGAIDYVENRQGPPLKNPAEPQA